MTDENQTTTKKTLDWTEAFAALLKGMRLRPTWYHYHYILLTNGPINRSFQRVWPDGSITDGATLNANEIFGQWEIVNESKEESK